MRSVSQALTGDGANIPAMCTLTTSPTMPSPLPLCLSCIGAIVITETITRLAIDSTVSPVIPLRLNRELCAFRGSTAETVPAGTAKRRPRASVIAAAAKAAAATRYGPQSAGSPRCPAIWLAGASRFGPATAPTVVAISTDAIAAVRDPSFPRSAAA